MRKLFKFLVLLLLGGAGLGYLLYPVLSDQYSLYLKNQRMDEYSEAVRLLPAEKRETMLSTAERYNAGLTEIAVTDVFTGKTLQQAVVGTEQTEAPEETAAPLPAETESEEAASAQSAEEAETTQSLIAETAVETEDAPEPIAESDGETDETSEPDEAQAEFAAPEAKETESETPVTENPEENEERPETPEAAEEPEETSSPEEYEEASSPEEPEETLPSETEEQEDTDPDRQPEEADTPEEAQEEEPAEEAEETEPPLPGYQQLLRVSGNVMGTLEIPRLGIRLPFYHANSGKKVTEDLIHLEGTSLPVGSAEGFTVLAGPGVIPAPEGILRDIGLTSAQMLGKLDKMTAGDIFILKVLDRTMLYQVMRVWSVSYNTLDSLTPVPGQDVVTIMTADKDQRLLVQGRRIRISSAETLLDANDMAAVPPDWLNIVVLGSPVVIFGFLVMFVIERVKAHAYRLPNEKRRRKN